MNRKHIIMLLIALLGFFALIANYSYQSVQERKRVIKQEQSMRDDKDAINNPPKLLNKVLGKKLFIENCSSCHGDKKRKHFELDQRLEVRGDEYFALYVNREDSLLEIEDEKTVFLNEALGGDIYTHKFDFSRSEMRQIFAYLRRD